MTSEVGHMTLAVRERGEGELLASAADDRRRAESPSPYQANKDHFLQ